MKTRTQMQVNVQVENVFMSATDYSPMKSICESKEPPTKQMIFIAHFPVGRITLADKRWEETL